MRMVEYERRIFRKYLAGLTDAQLRSAAKDSIRGPIGRAAMFSERVWKRNACRKECKPRGKLQIYLEARAEARP